MSEKQLRFSLLRWYREAVSGNPTPILVLGRAVENFYLFGLVSDELYDFCCCLVDDLIKLEKLDASAYMLGRDEEPDPDKAGGVPAHDMFDDIREEDLPFA